MPLEIKNFFEGYRDAFNALDGDAVSEFYAVPSGIAQDGTYTYWTESVLIAQNMTSLCEIYKQRGFAGAQFEAGAFIEQGDQYAIADLKWSIEWDRGQPPWKFKTTYNLVRRAEGWKILLCTAYSESALHRTALAD